jgi:hypothetical protein
MTKTETKNLEETSGRRHSRFIPMSGLGAQKDRSREALFAAIKIAALPPMLRAEARSKKMRMFSQSGASPRSESTGSGSQNFLLKK